jgi:adenylosuccinate synthase
MINGIERIAVTKLDVLDQLDAIPLCVGYEYRGRRLKTFPTDPPSLEQIRPVYETFNGWKSPLSGIRSYGELPVAARQYLEALARFTGTRISMVSVGPRRDQTITVE